MPADVLTQHYEILRAYVLARVAASAARLGHGTLMARGMAAWMKVAAELAGPTPAPAATWLMGLEVSRLARNSSDWHGLLEICALTHTLLLDEDGLYDPSHFNDRLLLGLNRPETQNTSCSTSR